MAIPYIALSGNSYYNINDCKSFNLNLASTSLSGLSAFPCSEVILINKGITLIQIFDNNNFDVANSLTLSAGETFTLRGITNSAMVSAKAPAGTGFLYYRGQMFSNNPSRY